MYFNLRYILGVVIVITTNIFTVSIYVINFEVDNKINPFRYALNGNL